MALNLSTLTNSATSGDVLAEALTTADFLESVPVLRNLARGSQKGGDAKQDVALNQPKALPLIDGDGYLYLSGITGNSATVPHNSSLNLTDQLEIVARLKYRSYSGADAQSIVTKWASGDFNFRFHTNGAVVIFFKDSTNTVRAATSSSTVYNNNILDGDTIWVKLTLDATSTSTNIDFYTSKDNVKNESEVTWTQLGTTKTETTSGGISSGTDPVSFGAFDNSGAINDDLATGAVLKANYKAAIGGTPVLDVDFTATNVRHGDTKVKCATGQVVTINQSGNDPATVIKKPVLRFDGANDGLRGLFANNINGGYMFAAFSVLGDGGEAYGRVFGANISGGFDYQNTGFALRRLDSTETLNLRYSGGSADTHQNLFDDDRGDLLLESRLAPSSQKSKVNDADANNGVTTIPDTGVAATQYSISSNSTGASNLAIDLEFLALFPATITDDQADSVRNYINNRNNVFSLIDSQGYYFFDPQIFPIVSPAAFVSYWNGNIVGSDNTLNASVSQSTVNDQPTRDGYKVTFNDNADHLVVASPLSGGQAGWQIVGTSLGTFAYRVDNDAVTELNLLGNAGTVRSIGDLYGIILLPASATGKDIEDARKLLIDRGASDGVSGNTVQQFWQSRNDIVEFKQVDTSSVTSFREGWRFCASLEIFPPLQAPNCTNFLNAWEGNSSLNSFGAIDASGGTTFTSAWKSCSSLTSFPAGAKLGTEANNVNFTNAWRSSGLTSFSTPVPTGSSFTSAWQSCSNLESFNSDFTSATNVQNAFLNCTSLVDFASGSFDVIGTPGNSCFLNTWSGCAALSANSVENILVSINTSGKSAPSTNPQITIDYNVATGSLSAATNSAVTSLKSKGWSIIVNNVTL